MRSHPACSTFRTVIRTVRRSHGAQEFRRRDRHRWEHGRTVGGTSAVRLLQDRHDRRADEPAAVAVRVAAFRRDVMRMPAVARPDTICRLFSSMRGSCSRRRYPVKWPRREVYHFDVWKCRYHSALVSSPRAAAIEWTVRARGRLPNVKTLHGCRSRASFRRTQHQRHPLHRRERSRCRAATECRSGDRCKRPRVADSAALRVLGFERPDESSVGSTPVTPAACSARPRLRATGRRCPSSRSRPRRRRADSAARATAGSARSSACTAIIRRPITPATGIPKTCPCPTCTKRCIRPSRWARSCVMDSPPDCVATTRISTASRPGLLCSAMRCAAQSDHTARA